MRVDGTNLASSATPWHRKKVKYTKRTHFPSPLQNGRSARPHLVRQCSESRPIAQNRWLCPDRRGIRAPLDTLWTQPDPALDFEPVTSEPIIPTQRLQKRPRCLLALEDGTVFIGEAFGRGGTRTGEVVFNTSMMGYQEILTDPSYCGQIVTMTYPLIGNYGINVDDVEASKPWATGFVVRELAARSSNHRSSQSLEAYLADHGVIGITGIDTRALTRRLRVDGAMRGVLSTEIHDPAKCVELARESPSMTGADLVQCVAPKDCFEWSLGLDSQFIRPRGRAMNAKRVVAIDCGMKRNILRHLVDLGCRVRVVPPTHTAEQILEDRPDGVFVSNGPGDPAAVTYAIATLRGLIGRVPIFGICLGHQLLALAMGAKTFKLKFGHRAANHPVRNVWTGKIEITSQNHGFAVDPDSLTNVGGVTTHVNLNDGTLEGFVHREHPILAVQYHPESSPGPHDASYLFDAFARMMETNAPPTAKDFDTAQTALKRRLTGDGAVALSR